MNAIADASSVDGTLTEMDAMSSCIASIGIGIEKVLGRNHDQFQSRNLILVEYNLPGQDLHQTFGLESCNTAPNTIFSLGLIRLDWGCPSSPSSNQSTRLPTFASRLPPSNELKQ